MDVLKALAHPSEVWSLLRFKYGGGKETVMPPLDLSGMTPSLKRCYELLNATSRSFAAVIQALDNQLRDAVCIFYLVLRALDTVEDDMTIPVEEKVPLLQGFYTNLYDPTWSYSESKEKDNAVLEEFPTITEEFRRLEIVYQDIIADITKKMGSGMCVFLEKDVGSLAEWDEYCHYVAGLVGIGLSRIFAASGLEDSVVGKDQVLANSMGLFLQKTNIIRDYLEDIVQGRKFWPKEAWGQYASSLEELQYPQNQTSALACLNLLITNALGHVANQLLYMSRLRNQSIFNFCAIPQVMAMATLVLCYNNLRVFSGVVKIRRGQAVALMMACTTMSDLKAITYHLAQELLTKICPQAPLAEETRKKACEIMMLCSDSPKCQSAPIRATPNLYPIVGAAAIVAVATYAAVQTV